MWGKGIIFFKFGVKCNPNIHGHVFLVNFVKITFKLMSIHSIMKYCQFLADSVF